MSDDLSVRAFIEDALEDLLKQPWMNIPELPTETPPWAGKETAIDLLADYRHALRGLQMRWLHETLTGGEPPTPEQAAFCNGRIQIAEAVRGDLLLIIDYAKGGPSDG